MAIIRRCLATAGLLLSGPLFAASLEGQITLDGEQGLPYLSVVLIAPDQARTATFTGNDGRYYLDDLDPGAYTLEVSQGTRLIFRDSVELSDDQTANRDIVFHAAESQQSNRAWYPVMAASRFHPDQYGVDYLEIDAGLFLWPQPAEDEDAGVRIVVNDSAIAPEDGTLLYDGEIAPEQPVVLEQPSGRDYRIKLLPETEPSDAEHAGLVFEAARRSSQKTE